jgi:hypothetical protein
MPHTDSDRERKRATVRTVGEYPVLAGSTDFLLRVPMLGPAKHRRLDRPITVSLGTSSRGPASPATWNAPDFTGWLRGPWSSRKRWTRQPSSVGLPGTLTAEDTWTCRRVTCREERSISWT